MQIKIYLSDGTNKIAVVDVVSRLTKIRDLRKTLHLKLGVPVERQRLFYMGKELLDAQTLYDYGMNHADVVHLFVTMVLAETNSKSKGKTPKKPSTSKTKGKSPRKTDSATKPKDESSKDSSNVTKKARTTRRSLAASDWAATAQPSTELATNVRPTRKSATASEEATLAEPPTQSDLPESAGTPNVSELSTDVVMATEAPENPLPAESNTEPPKTSDLPSTAESSNKSESDLADESPKKSPALSSSDESPRKKLKLNLPPTTESLEQSTNLPTEVESPEKELLPECSDKSADSDMAVEEKQSTSNSESQGAHSAYFKVGDTVYTRDFRTGEWESSSVLAITKRDAASDMELQARSSSSEPGTREEEDLIYRVERGFDKDGVPIELSVLLQDIRLGAQKSIKPDELKEGMVVLTNYNHKAPTKPGAWYETLITKVKAARTGTDIYGIVFAVPGVALPEVKLVYKYDIIPLAELKKLEERDKDEGIDAICLGDPCSGCKGNPDKLCFECNCVECGKGDDPESQIMCEECDDAYHIGCLDPPLEEIPTADWFCKDCKRDDGDNIVKSGEQLKKSKLKAKMPSTIAAENGIKLRDWGRGNSTMGVTKKCSIVPENHFGPIPGVEVGTCWKWRRLASEAGVHRPPVAGIHGRGPEGAYSLVLSGGYEDDEDKGTEFFYTGAGGRDLSGNKRCSVQSFDQELTQTNLALARNCDAPINDVTGATAKDWRKGKPVRVIRGFKLAKHSKYAPKDGLRYDGCYKVVSYKPKTGKSGFKVWQYLLRRDDSTPAPWTPEGIKYIKEHGLDHVIDDTLTEEKEMVSKGKKRKAADSAEEEPAAKVPKVKAFKPDKELSKLIEEDNANKAEWKNLMKVAEKGKIAFLNQVKESFMCPCCQDLVSEPINTTYCKHVVCKACLGRSYAAEVFNCPTCRTEFSKTFEFETNSTLSTILTSLFPGYNACR